MGTGRRMSRVGRAGAIVAMLVVVAHGMCGPGDVLAERAFSYGARANTIGFGAGVGTASSSSSGVFQYQYPIEVPPNRLGFEPGWCRSPATRSAMARR